MGETLLPLVQRAFARLNNRLATVLGLKRQLRGQASDVATAVRQVSGTCWLFQKLSADMFYSSLDNC